MTLHHGRKTGGGNKIDEYTRRAASGGPTNPFRPEKTKNH